MRTRILLAALIASLLVSIAPGQATPGFVHRYAGVGGPGRSGDGGPALEAKFLEPSGLAFGERGLFVANMEPCTVRLIDPQGIVHTYAGVGQCGYSGDGGPATSAMLRAAWDVALDHQGNLFVTEWWAIRRIDAETRTITTVAGTGVEGAGPDGVPATQSQINRAFGMTLDSVGNLYIAEFVGGRIRKVDAATGIITTIAGGGQLLNDGAPATEALLETPVDLVFDSKGNLLILEMYPGRVRRLDAVTGTITRIAGGGPPQAIRTVPYPLNKEPVLDPAPARLSTLWYPKHMTIDANDNIYVDQSGEGIRMIDAKTNLIRFVAGNSAWPYRSYSPNDDIPATALPINWVNGLAISPAGDLFFTDDRAHVIRWVDLF